MQERLRIEYEVLQVERHLASGVALDVKDARNEDRSCHADTENAAEDACDHLPEYILNRFLTVSEEEIDDHEDYFLNEEEVIDGAVDEDREHEERSLLFVVDRLYAPEQQREKCHYIVEVEEHEVYCLETRECIKERADYCEVILLTLSVLSEQTQIDISCYSCNGIFQDIKGRYEIRENALGKR